jgi:uncharacterized membrane protein
MALLILGVALWAAAHLFKRLAPARRAALSDKGKGLVAVVLAVSVVLMVVGYRAADGTVLWGRSAALVGINNLFMLLAFYIYAASVRGTRITRWIRHAQLTSVVVWSFAHLLVNGDTPSFVLFGGLAAWAVVQMGAINRAEGPRAPYVAPAMKSEVLAVVISLFAFTLVALLHLWLGYNPFG